MKRKFIAGVMGLALAGCAHFPLGSRKGTGQDNPTARSG